MIGAHTSRGMCWARSGVTQKRSLQSRQDISRFIRQGDEVKEEQLKYESLTISSEAFFPVLVFPDIVVVVRSYVLCDLEAMRIPCNGRDGVRVHMVDSVWINVDSGSSAGAKECTNALEGF